MQSRLRHCSLGAGHRVGGADAQEAVEQYRRLLGEVEALVAGEGALPDCSPPPAVVLPAVLHNLHDFFCHVAARLERLHDSVATLRQAFLAHRRQVRPPPPPPLSCATSCPG